MAFILVSPSMLSMLTCSYYLLSLFGYFERKHTVLPDERVRPCPTRLTVAPCGLCTHAAQLNKLCLSEARGQARSTPWRTYEG